MISYQRLLSFLLHEDKKIDLTMVQDQAFGKYYSSPPETVGNIFNDKLEYNPVDWFLDGSPWLCVFLRLSPLQKLVF